MNIVNTSLVSFFILFFTFFCSFSSRAQDSTATALQIEIDKATSDSIRIPLQLQLASHTQTFNVEKARAMVHTILGYIEDKNYTSGYYTRHLADVYNEFGEYAHDQGDQANALHYYLQALTIREKMNDSIAMGRSYHNLGNLYYGKGDSNKAKSYTRKAIKIRQALGKGHSFDLAMSFNNLALVYDKSKQPDSAFYYFEKAKEVDQSENALVTTNSNIAFLYTRLKEYDKAIPIFEESITIMKAKKEYKSVSSHYTNLSYIHRTLGEYDKAMRLIDSAIFYAKAIGNKKQLENEYYSRHTIHKLKGDYKEAYEDYKMSKTYLDSIHNIEELNRFTKLELNAQFEKEKEVAALSLQAEEAKKRLYFILLFVALLLGVLIVYFLIKDKRQKITLAKKEVALTEMEKIKSDLALANRENELKKVVIENSITEEVLNKTLDDIKEIITYENESKRKVALRSLSVSLLSEKTTQKDTIGLQSYVDEVEMEFKILLDQKFPEFNRKEKELLYLIKLGLTTIEVSKILNTSISAVKSKRYRIRKKLDIDPSVDIIAHIEQHV